MSDDIALIDTVPKYACPVKMREDGIIVLGGAKGAVENLACWATEEAKKDEHEPGLFSHWVADRVLGESKLDLVFLLSGRRGSGKSYSALFLCYQIARVIAEKHGGTWSDYFKIDNFSVLEDSDRIANIMQSAGMYQILFLDDAGIAAGSREWNTIQNRNLNAIFSVCRVKRWILILTVPLGSMIDLQIRQMTDLNATIVKSFHAAGFNLMKIKSKDVSEFGGKKVEIEKRMSFCDEKIDYFVAFRPPADLVKQYDEIRLKMTEDIVMRVATTGTFKSENKKRENKGSKRDETFQKLLEKHQDEFMKEYMQNPDATVNYFTQVLPLSHSEAGRIARALGLTLRQGNRKRGV